VRDAPRLPAPLGAGLKTYRKFSTAEFNDKARWSRRLTGLVVFLLLCGPLVMQFPLECRHYVEREFYGAVFGVPRYVLNGENLLIKIDLKKLGLFGVRGAGFNDFGETCWFASRFYFWG